MLDGLLVSQRLRGLAERLLPAALLERLHSWKSARDRRRYPQRTVEHSYAGRRLRVTIGSAYAERYDRDWPALAEIDMLREGRLRGGALVFDLGASAGVIAMMLADAVGGEGRVLALEAHPGDASLARRNRDLNGLTQLEIVNAAVARASGELAFSPAGHVHTGSRGRPRVPAWSIDDLAARHGPPDVVFIDVEGYEYEALMGAERTLRGSTDWFVEVHSHELARYGSATSDAVLACFDPSRFRLFAAADRLALVGGTRLVSLTAFRPLEDCPPELVRERFFLIARSRG
jgi:FkbM family methyltransferase